MICADGSLIKAAYAMRLGLWQKASVCILLFSIHALATGRSRSAVGAPRMADDMPT